MQGGVDPDADGVHVHGLGALGSQGQGCSRVGADGSGGAAGAGVGIGSDNEVDAAALGVASLGLVIEPLDHFAQGEVIHLFDLIEADAVEFADDDLAAGARCR